jgi:hypothetical protein
LGLSILVFKEKDMVGVACFFDEEGKITVRRISMDNQWIDVSQGRQWVDDEGLHVLIMLANDRAHELILDRSSMNWILKSLGGNDPVWV